MSEVSFTNLNLKTDESVHTIDFNGTTIEIRNYLTTAEKLDLINATLQKSKEKGFYNPFKLNIYCNLHLIYLYSNLTFTEEDYEDELALYDKLESSGLAKAILDSIDSVQHMTISGFLTEVAERREKYNHSLPAMLDDFVNGLPKNAEDAANLIKQFDPEQFKEVLQFARAANGNRPIE